ncbi:GCG_CRPN prefix-to-repeats domain-containing protein [Rhizobium helianthi]|uniref:GCG_CRPN prefix-to-repeats domain-containing protein n=1 Tax=Rhizobium helianthi TaxID=1132695 RepID=A0ABW4M8H5_9HYPH
MKALVLAAAMLAAGAVSTQAQPLAVKPKIAPTGVVEKVDYACGPGWRLNRWGACVPRRGPPPPRYYRPPPPPPGWGWGPPRHHRHHHRDWDRPRHHHRDWGPPPPRWY